MHQCILRHHAHCIHRGEYQLIRFIPLLPIIIISQSTDSCDAPSEHSSQSNPTPRNDDDDDDDDDDEYEYDKAL
jgi:hypothetical protein